MVAVCNNVVIRSISFGIDVFAPKIPVANYKKFIGYFAQSCLMYPEFTRISRAAAIHYNITFTKLGVEKIVHTDNVVIPRVIKGSYTVAFGKVTARRAFFDFAKYQEYQIKTKALSWTGRT